jgi:hypothetical protein
MRVEQAIATWRVEKGHPPSPKERWYQIFWVKLGPISVPIPHPGQLHWHDLHHMALGYETDLPGEMEISAFELRTGPRTWMVWILCLLGVTLGTFRCPRRILASWRRGKGARNLYAGKVPYETVMGWSVDELRAWMLAIPSTKA